MTSETTFKLVHENGDWKTYFNEETNQFTRENTKEARTYHWQGRGKPKKPVFTAKNGVTIAMLEAAGHKLRVRHLRWALYLGQSERPRKRLSHDFELRAICVPSTFRKDPMYSLLPKGGYSHISIKTPEGKYICVSSECSEEDPFCYQLGTVKALERLTKQDIELLGLGV
jgi:hypothetical protein